MSSIYRLAALVFLCVSFAVCGAVSFAAEKPDSDEAVYDSSCVKEVVHEDVMRLVSPLKLKTAFTKNWEIENYRLLKGQIVFELNNPRTRTRVEVFVSVRDDKQPAYKRTKYFDIRYKKEKTLVIGEDEENAISELATTIKGNEKNSKALLFRIENTFDDCQATTEASTRTGLRVYALGPMMQWKFMGIPAFIPLILIVLILLYIFTWWLEQRGQKRES